MLTSNDQIVKDLKAQYLPGVRVALVKMDDPYVKIPVGTQGNVINVDDTGTIHVSWDIGIRLGVVYGEDECRIV